jgi:hypothetical protein
MVQRNRNLYEALQEFPLRFRGDPPDVLKDFMGVEERPLVEQPDSFPVVLRIHA